jgi:hypothetical protein
MTVIVGKNALENNEGQQHGVIVLYGFQLTQTPGVIEYIFMVNTQAVCMNKDVERKWQPIPFR